jgi:hypothetical protein
MVATIDRDIIKAGDSLAWFCFFIAVLMILINYFFIKIFENISYE